MLFMADKAVSEDSSKLFMFTKVKKKVFVFVVQVRNILRRSAVSKKRHF